MAEPLQAAAKRHRETKATHRATDRFGWGRGIEGQRRADLGDGTYRNPIVPGDHPDPAVLKDGDDYYMTFSSFFSYPGVVIWHSRDLVNWIPIGTAVTRPLGSIWAMDLVKHEGRFYIYIPASPGGQQSIFVVHADNIAGPWSDPIDLKVSGCIDPGHAVGEDGKRYLFFAGVRRIALTDDGLATVGALEQAYTPWRVSRRLGRGDVRARRTETVAARRMVLSRHGRRRHVRAPDQSHGRRCARALHPRSLAGLPAQPGCPHQKRRRAVVVARPRDGGGRTERHMVAHLSWLRKRLSHLGPANAAGTDGMDGRRLVSALGGTLSSPMAKPLAGPPLPAGFALSDDFSTNRFGVQWSFFNPGADEAKRARYEANALVISAKGTTLADCSPLTFIVGDRNYEASIALEIGEGVQAGIALFYSERMFCGCGFSNQQMFTYNYGEEQSWMRQDLPARTVRLKVVNRANIVTFFYARDGGAWVQHPWQMEVSGYHHNVLGGFLSLKFGVYCAGAGEAKLRDFVYKGLEA